MTIALIVAAHVAVVLIVAAGLIEVGRSHLPHD